MAVEQLLVRLLGDGSSYQRTLKTAVSNTKQFEQTINNVSARITSFGNTVQSTGIKLSAAVTAPLAGLATMAIRSSIEAEKLATSLNVLAGSAEAGRKQYERLLELSTKTPFEPRELIKVNNTLLGFGMNVDQAFESVKMLGDVSSLTGAQLSNVAIAFGQSAAAGKAMTADLNQFVNNSIPIYDLLGQVTGKNVGELREMASQGKITFDLLNEAFKKGTFEGGKFFKGMEKLSETTGGKLSTLKGNFDLLIQSLVGTDGVLEPYIDKLNEILLILIDLNPETKRMAVLVAGVAAAVGPLVLTIGSLLKVMAPLMSIMSFAVSIMGAVTGPVGSAVVAFVSLLNPVVAIIAAVAALVVGLRLMIGSWEDTGTVIKNIADLAVDVWITATQTLQRLIQLALIKIGMLVYDLWNAIWTVDYVAAVKKGIKMSKRLFLNFTGWLGGKFARLFGMETFKKESVRMAVATNRLAKGESFSAVAFRALQQGMGDFKQLREGKEVIPQRGREAIQANLASIRGEASKKMEETAKNTKEMVRLLKEAAQKAQSGATVSLKDLGLE